MISWDKYGQSPENPCSGNSVIRIMEEDALKRGALHFSDKKVYGS